MIRILRIFFVLVFFAGLLSCKQTKDPNVLLIIVDDLGYADLGCTGLADDVKTPNIDRIAENGVRFTQAYATSPICSPSRGGIITGCYHERWGTTWYGGPGLHDENFRTIPELLKQKNYACGYVGKVHYGSHDHDTTHRSFPLNHGFDYYFGHTSPRKHYLNHKQSLEDAFQQVKKDYNKWGQSLRQQPMWENFGTVDTIGFSTELFGKKACEFIETHRNEPFFLQLSFNAVHNFTHQLPETYLKNHGLKGYHDWDPSTEEYYEWYKTGRYPNNAEGREHYLGQLYFLDREIGRVMDCLNNLGLDKNTLVIFISDNGGSTPIYANNFPLKGSKYLLYEGGTRVPMIITFPDKYLTGIVSDNVISAMDILPTICAVTGIETPDYVDGKNLNPLLSGTDTTIRHELLFWDTGLETAVRSGKWKLHTAKSDVHAKYEMVALELGEFLFDLQADPGEEKDLKDDFPEIFNELQALHQQWKSGMDKHYLETMAFRKELNAQYGDPERSPLLPEDQETFEGLEFYPFNQKFRIESRFVRTPEELPFEMKTSTDRLPVYVKYGEAHFEFEGKKHILSIFQNVDLVKNEEYKNYLFLPYTDLTSGVTSYGGGRYIDLEIPEGETIVLDFNKSYNPYCAYNYKYSCPIPPLENRLDIEIKAGVKAYH